MYSPFEIAKIANESSEYKVNRKFLKVLVSAILAGIFIGLGYYAYIIIRANSGINEGLNIFLGSVIFSVGIVMVLIAGADLFTGSCLVMFGVFDKKIRFGKALNYLLIVLLGNFIGGLVLAILIYYSNIPSDQVISYISSIFMAKTALSFWEALLRGILCNILVAIGVYMAYGSKNISGKILAAVFPVSAFVVTGFEHIVANMFILPLGLMYPKLLPAYVGVEFDMFMNIIINNVIPVTIGNFIGGGIILPLAYHYIYLSDKNTNH